MNNKAETIGFIGVGLMGQGIAKNLLNAGYPVYVLAHRNRASVEDLLSKGAQEINDLADMARATTVIHICAPGSPEVETIVAELLPDLRPDTVIINCSTSDPKSTTRLATRLAEHDCYMADAPLGGTPAQAESGQLSTMISATDAIFARIQPVVATWAKSIVHMGDNSAGHKMKLLNNFLSLGYAAMYSEALALAEKVGITTAQFDSVIRGSRMDCGFYQTFMGYALNGNREAHKFTLKNALKDTNYLAKMADGVYLANPISGAVKNSFALAFAAGGDGLKDYVPHLVDYVMAQNGVKN